MFALLTTATTTTTTSAAEFNFGFTLDNFKATKDPVTGSYSLSFSQ
jgi:hypothetical protein